MKSKKYKFGLVFTIICNVSVVLFLVISIESMFNVESPDKIEKNDFIKYMENKGCSIIDMKEKENYSGVETYLVTDEKSCPYLVSYATFSDKNRLKEFFSSGKKDVLKVNNNVTGRTSVEINLFSEYYEYSTSGDYYKAIVYNNNSVLYASVNKEYRSEAINIFKDLNYKYEPNFNGMKIEWCSLFATLLICIVSMWGVEKKIRNKGWISLIPFYNIGCLSNDVLGSPWFALLLFLPIGNVVFMFIFYYNMGKAFNKSDSYCLLMMFFPSVLWPLLAFDDSTYTKPEKKKKEVISQPIEQVRNNDSVKSIEIKTEEQISIGKKTIGIIKWIFTICFLLFGALLVLTYLDEKLIGYLLVGILFIIYGLLLCPAITDSTKKYEKYTRFKPLIVIFLIILLIVIFCVSPF